jgi:hypothetical protein
MNQERLDQILQLLQDPGLKVHLAKNPTTMGPAYISGKAVEIAEAKGRVNDLGEELEIALSKADINLSELKEQFDLRTEIALINLQPGEIEGMDATARKAMAKQKAEKSWHQEMIQLVQEQNQILPSPFLSLRAEIMKAESWAKQLKVVTKIVDNRRQDLTRLDSTLRLQVTSLQVEAGLFGRRIGGTPQPGTLNNFTRTPQDDSISGGIEDGLVGNDSFHDLISDLPERNQSDSVR